MSLHQYGPDSLLRDQAHRTGRMIAAAELALCWIEVGDSEAAARTLRDALDALERRD